METSALSLAKDLLQFIDASPTPFHVVREIKRRLDEAGFEELKESDDWLLQKDGKYYVARGSSIIAFIGTAPVFEHGGFKIIGAHTDSPALKLKANYAYNKAGYLQFGVEPYGGGIWRTWLDRDLYIAGRAVACTPKGNLVSYLVELKDLVVSIPSLAIHLQRDVNENGSLNSQTDIPCIVALDGVKNTDAFDQQILSSCPLSYCKVISSSLSLCSAESGALAGLDQEFIRAGQLDDLASCHEAITALINTEKPLTTCVVSFWNHEEVGSQSAEGAGGTFLQEVLERIVEKTSTKDLSTKSDFQRAIAKSFCISADMAHAIHPNHPEKHDPHHSPRIGGGPVIKWNASQRYATNDHTAAIFARLCDIAGVKNQSFASRSDLPCGSTIGPITSTGLSVSVVDVGIPMLAMHSIREQCGVEDHFAMKKVFETFFSRGQEEIIEI